MVLELLKNPIIFHSLIILGSLIILSRSADLAVYGISNYAKKLGLSDYLIGLVVVSLAASTPELIASLNGLVLDEGGVVLGTIIGSNIVELTLVLAAFAIVGKKIKLNVKALKGTEWIIFGLNTFPFILLIDGRLSRIDGLLLLAAFAGYLYLVWRKEGQLGHIKKDVKLKSLWRDAAIFMGTLVAILLSSRWLVHSSISLANTLDISIFFVSVVVIGIGASMSDMTVGIRSVLQGHQDVGFGNALGSNITKSLLFLGLIALISPISFAFNQLIIAIIFSMISLGLTLWFVKKEMITWKQGILLLIIYAAFVALEWIFGSGTVGGHI